MRSLISRRSSRTLALVAALLLSPGCTLIDRMSGVGEAKKLRESGMAGSAKILAVWDTGITVNDDPVIAMRVEVTRPDGSVYSATIPKSLISRLDIPRFQPGSTVPVRIDPNDPLHMAVDVYNYR
jgi:hypothetical protein